MCISSYFLSFFYFFIYNSLILVFIFLPLIDFLYKNNRKNWKTIKEKESPTPRTALLDLGKKSEKLEKKGK